MGKETGVLICHEKVPNSFPFDSPHKMAIVNLDELVKSPFGLLFVIPAKAGIQLIQIVLDSCLRRSDGFSDFLRDHQS